MKGILSPVCASVAVLLMAVGNAPATVRYVDLNNASPTSPYTSWATAATNIQDAVDAASAGDTILVTNGIYQTGGRLVSGVTTTNRVAVTKAVAIQSVNGPEFTIIRGYQVPGVTNGAAAIRCAYLTNGASLSGFTLTSGATTVSGSDVGGGVYCYSTNVLVTNCVLVGNSASYRGGGAAGGTLVNCRLDQNSAGHFPGVGNGGGAYASTLMNSTLSGNWAGDSGGGAYQGRLRNCVLAGNSANGSGGGVSGAALTNCTLTGNSAYSGGGAHNSALYNSIVYHNTALEPQFVNYYISSFVRSCTTPHPGGSGNIVADPQLASASHVSAASPCRGTGSAIYASGTDIDGEAWFSPPSRGCDEYHAGALTGPLIVGITATLTTVMTNYPVRLSALIEGLPTASDWDFGDGQVATNQPSISHSWAATGDYSVILRAYNESLPAGISATVTVHVVERPIHYVASNSVTPIAPFNSWATAAVRIQDAVDAAVVPGALVLVTNGTYATGGRTINGSMTNRVGVAKLLELRSVNGPQFTIIQGRQVPGTTNGTGAIRCVYLANGASMAGFTLTNGATISSGSGGGLWCESTAGVVSNCVLTGNAAASSGGGASLTLNSLLFDCTLIGNRAGTSGGGTWGGVLTNCTLTGNAASQGGGVYGAKLNNCWLTGNSATEGGGAYQSTLSNCTLSNNTAVNYGGGAAGYCTLTDCTLTSNTATNASFGSGGGAHSSTLARCTLTGNTASASGGGVSVSAVPVTNCVFIGNSAPYGGGAVGGTLINCTLTANLAAYGGGANNATLNNCTITGNTAGAGGGASGCILAGCTLTGNAATSYGGGADGATLSRCILLGNTAPLGGGVFSGALDNCLLKDNAATDLGGGVYGGTLNNCTLMGNSAAVAGGGTHSTGLTNCIVYFNSAPEGTNYFQDEFGDPVLSYCCTTPLPTNGVGNITNVPLFVDHAGGNLRLQSNSPCLNAGNNASVIGSSDLDGRARIVGGTVDIGAYEFQPGISGEFLGWLQQYGLPTDGSGDNADADGDQLNNLQEWYTGTVPTNALSILRLLNPAGSLSGRVVTWQSVTNRTYFLERSVNLSASEGFLTLATNLAGQTGTTTFTDTDSPGSGPFFYRVGIQ